MTPSHDVSAFEISPLGDAALVVRVGVQIDEPTRRRVTAVANALNVAAIDGVLDVVPGFTTVTVHYAPTRLGVGSRGSWLPYDAVHSAVASCLANLDDDQHADDGRLIEIPVCYGGDLGPDLDDVARHATLTTSEVVATHTRTIHRVHMLGFMPGFAYLGGLDPRLVTPRRSTPRARVAAGSVGIGGAQTGVYPLATPGGWQLIGRTPLALFDPHAAEPNLLRAGDRVQFVAIDRDEYDARLGARR